MADAQQLSAAKERVVKTTCDYCDPATGIDYDDVAAAVAELRELEKRLQPPPDRGAEVANKTFQIVPGQPSVVCLDTGDFVAWVALSAHCDPPIALSHLRHVARDIYRIAARDATIAERERCANIATGLTMETPEAHTAGDKIARFIRAGEGKP